MRAAPRRHLSHASLTALLAVDAWGLIALILDQWVAADSGWAWLLAAVLALAFLPLLLRLVDRVFAAAGAGRNIPFAGGTFP